jgi:hypothetical protein
MPPERLLICRFAAEPPQGPLPYGDWAQTLQAEFLAACLRVETDDIDLGEPGEVRWYPDRTWAGRTYVPATSLTGTGVELYGYVSFAPGDAEQEPSDFAAWADYTQDTAEQHPEWRLDVSEEVVGGWRGDAGEVAAMTLVWGVPLMEGGATVTAELDGTAVDQCAILDGRFTLLAPDAYRDAYLEIALWDGRANQLARESLYEEEDEAEG